MKIKVVLYHLVTKTMNFTKKLGQIGGHIEYLLYEKLYLNLIFD